MSMVPTCVVCDAKVDPYGGEIRCARCEQPCEVCGKDLAYCRHPLRGAPYSELKRTGTGGWL
jgi:ribosomal protein S14